MATRYARRRLYISFDGMDEPLEAIVLSSFRDCGCYYYRIKLVEDGQIMDVQARGVSWIMHRRSRVVPLKKIRQVK